MIAQGGELFQAVLAGGNEEYKIPHRCEGSLHGDLFPSGLFVDVLLGFQTLNQAF